MNGDELVILERAHQLFSGESRSAPLDAATRNFPLGPVTGLNNGAGDQRYRLAAARSRARFRNARHVDDAVAALVVRAAQDHAEGRRQTRAVLEQARADVPVALDTPMGRREALRRRAARLRAQHRHVALARRRARRLALALRVLRYRLRRSRAWLRRARLAPNRRAALAIRAALSRLGRPYVWGAEGPNAFDCSGLVQWAYEHAGIRLDRTTYQQIHHGIPVPWSLVQPGDLVFPNPGHVQIAIGNNQVVEAPYAGAEVRISELGTNVHIRRPVL